MFVSTYGHELFHALSAKIFNIPIYKIHLGAECFVVKFGIVEISLFPVRGYLEVDEDRIRNSKIIKKFIFCFSGCAWNIILVFVLHSMNIPSIVGTFGEGLNLLYIFINCIPMVQNNDIMRYLELL